MKILGTTSGGLKLNKLKRGCAKLQIEYEGKKAWPLGFSGEGCITFSVSSTPGPINRKIVIIGETGEKIVFINRAASEFLLTIQEIKTEWDDTL